MWGKVIWRMYYSYATGGIIYCRVCVYIDVCVVEGHNVIVMRCSEFPAS